MVQKADSTHKSHMYVSVHQQEVIKLLCIQCINNIINTGH